MYRSKRSLLILLSLVLLIEAKAQQTSLFNTYSFDLMQLNIAAAGQRCFEARLNYRKQWAGVKEAPQLYQLNSSVALGNSNGLGLRIGQQSMGLIRISNLTLGYSYRVKLTETSKLHFGVGLTWQQNQLSSSKAIVLDQNDATLEGNESQFRSNNFDTEAGVLFLGDKWTIGVSGLHLYNTNKNFASTGYNSLPQINTVIARKFNKGKAIEIEPWLVDRLTINGKNQPEAMLNFKLQQLITVGAGYRFNYGYLAMAGFEKGKFTVAYSFDYSSGKNAGALGSSHQVLVGINLCRIRNKKEKNNQEFTVIENPQENPPVKEEVLQEKPVVKEEIIVVAPILPKEEPNTSPEAERLQKEAAALKEINFICEGLVFRVNKTTLPVYKASELDKIAKIIKDNNLTITVKGYASKDGNPIRNERLSKLRASYVEKELIKRGVSPDKINHLGVGESEELFDNNNPQVKNKNRTVRINRLTITQ